MLKIRRRVYEILNAGNKNDWLGKFTDIVLITLISLNVLMVILESVPSIAATAPTFFSIFEIFSVIVFTIEYIFRVWSVPEHSGPKYAHPFLVAYGSCSHQWHC